jgi:hypothetical protein
MYARLTFSYLAAVTTEGRATTSPPFSDVDWAKLGYGRRIAGSSNRTGSLGGSAFARERCI